MTPDSARSVPNRPRRSGALLWTAAGTLLAAEALVFYVLCSHQVHKAEARRSVSQVESQAFSDCLAYVQGATIASCGRAMMVRR